MSIFKSTTLFFLFFVGLASCNQPSDPPEFRRVTNIRLSKIEGTQALLKADAYFFNPNDVKMKLKKVNVDLSVEGKKVGKIDQEMKTEIPAMSEFKVPVDATFSMKDMGFFSTALSLLGGKTMKVHYEGFVSVVVHGIPIRVPVDYEDDVKFSY